jgi:hypothetical protein
MDLYFIGEGFIGQEASIAFRDYVEKYERQVTVQDILDGKKSEIVESFGINDANIMIDKIADSDLYKKDVTDEQIENVAKFVYGMSPELAMKAWEALTRSNGDAVAKMWGIKINDEMSFGSYIKDIVGTKKED